MLRERVQDQCLYAVVKDDLPIGLRAAVRVPKHLQDPLLHLDRRRLLH